MKISQIRSVSVIANVTLLLLAAFGAQSIVIAAPVISPKIPDWVDPAEPYSSDTTELSGNRNGTQLRLSDYQINAIDPLNTVAFTGISYQLISQSGVESKSTIRINYEPSYENIEVHAVEIMRAGKVFDRLANAKSRILNKEGEIDNLIYTGEQTFVLLLEDILPGDTLYYAYSVHGQNPVFGGLAEYFVPTNFSIPVNHINFRLLTSKDRNLAIKKHQVDFLPIKKQLGSTTETTFSLSNVPAVKYYKDAPHWRNNYGGIVLTDTPDWADVVLWEAPLYESSMRSTDEIRSVARDILARNHSTEAQVGQALKWVQRTVRYFGIETGENSHRPSSPAETLERRYGDCKDKTVLLVTLLREMGIPAEPALVHTKRKTLLEDRALRLHAFNHVVTHLKVDGSDHWIDPTRPEQRGKLGQFHEPDFGMALILSPNSIELSSMSSNRSTYSYEVDKVLEFTSNNESQARITVRTLSRELSAEKKQNEVDDNGLNTLSYDYEDYYRGYYDGIELLENAKFQQTPRNTNYFEEFYKIDDFWTVTSNGSSVKQVVADEILGYLKKPRSVRFRDLPVKVSFPIEVVESWTISLPEIRHQYEFVDKVHTPFFRLKRTINQNSVTHVARVRYSFQTLVREVPADKTLEYYKAIQDARDLLSMRFTDSGFIFDGMETNVVPAASETLTEAVMD